MAVTTYKVTGPTPFQGHKPGETFDADLDENAERRAIARGSIKKTPKKKEDDSDA